MLPWKRNMVLKKKITKKDAYGILTAGLLLLMMFPFVVTNYTPLIIFDIIGIGISLTLISVGVFILWWIKKHSK